MKNFTIGSWSYIKSNNTLLFKTKRYTYEIDLDKKQSPDEWIEHLLESKCEEIMPVKEINNLALCCEKLELKVDKKLMNENIDFYQPIRTE